MRNTVDNNKVKCNIKRVFIVILLILILSPLVFRLCMYLLLTPPISENEALRILNNSLRYINHDGISPIEFTNDEVTIISKEYYSDFRSETYRIVCDIHGPDLKTVIHSLNLSAIDSQFNIEGKFSEELGAYIHNYFGTTNELYVSYETNYQINGRYTEGAFYFVGLSLSDGRMLLFVEE